MKLSHLFAATLLVSCLTAITTAQEVDERFIPFSFKNTTSLPIYVAYGFNEGTEFTSTGWMEIKPRTERDGFYTGDGLVYYYAFAWDGQRSTKVWSGSDRQVFIEYPSQGFRFTESQIRTGGNIRKQGMKRVTIRQRGQVISLQ